MKTKKMSNEAETPALNKGAVSSSAGYVIGKCISCGHKKKYDLRQERNFTMMCEKCFMPMTAVKVVGRI
jgi:hypothetical protein